MDFKNFLEISGKIRINFPVENSQLATLLRVLKVTTDPLGASVNYNFM